MWRVYNAAKRPWPVLHPDPVIDYLIMEAVAVKVAKEDEEAQKQAERDSKKQQWETEAQQRLEKFRDGT
jgi:hypothetical protein